MRSNNAKINTENTKTEIHNIYDTKQSQNENKSAKTISNIII